MSSEYALIQLLLRTPHLVVDLQRKGVRSKFFKIKNYGKVYKLIYDRHTRLQSLPTEDELSRLDVKFETEDIPYTINHLLENIIQEYKKNLLKDIIRLSSEEVVTENGADKAEEILLKGLSLLPNLDKAERSKNINDLNEDIWDSYIFKEEHKGQITGIPTGFSIFDNHTMGLQPQWLTIISGRNGTGKTWILTKWILNAWAKSNTVAVYSCEMSCMEIAYRVHALATNIPPTKFLKGTLSDNEKEKFKQHLEISKNQPFGKLILNDNPVNMTEISDDISKINEVNPVDIIFIDSAYRMQGPGDSDTTRQAGIARAAKDLAKKYNVPVVCTVQLNRDFAKANSTDKGKEKTTSGGHFVHGTDAWNQDSDIMLVLNQPEVYKPYDYLDFILQKFRHGQMDEYILELNLTIPKIDQIDVATAKARIIGAPPPATQRGQQIFDMAQKVFQDNENVLEGSDVLTSFMEHRKKLEQKRNLENNNEPPKEIGE